MKNLGPLLISIFLCVVMSGCSRQQHFFRRKLYFTKNEIYTTKPPATPTITVWIHGACPFAYNTYNLGLRQLAEFDPKNELALIADTLIHSDPITFNPHMFYIFSWSGALDFEERKKAAEVLYKELSKQIALFKKEHDFAPKIRLIAHSHGGNVALNLALIPDNTLEINELLLLAVPVQNYNKHLIQSPLFKRIFSLYSTIDLPQVIDPQGIYKNSRAESFFSGQRFTPCHNLMQVKVKINGTACRHLQFNANPMLSILSSIIEQLNQWMNEIPVQDLLCDKNRFMLSVYTNGRKPPTLKKYLNPKYGKHITISLPV